MASTTRRPLVIASSLVWGLQFSFLSPTLALLLVALYHASMAEVGWVLSVYNAAGFVGSLLIPAWADRRRTYLRWLAVASVATTALAAVMWCVTTVPAALAALVVLGAPAGVGSSLLFAHLKDTGASVTDVTNTRAVMSFAWVVGPPVATLMMGSVGNRSILAVVALTGLVNLFITRLMHVGPAREAVAPLERDDSSLPKVLVAVVLAAFVLLQATNSASVSVMTLFVTEQLHLAAVWAGVALAVCAACEVPMFMLVGRLAMRHSNAKIVISGCLVGIVFYAGMALAHGPVLLVALQVLNAYFIAVVSGIGLTWFQEMIPGAGLASGMFLNTRRVGAIVSGPVIAVGAASAMGQNGIFAVCAVMTVVGMAVVGWVGFTHRRSQAG